MVRLLIVFLSLTITQSIGALCAASKQENTRSTGAVAGDQKATQSEPSSGLSSEPQLLTRVEPNEDLRIGGGDLVQVTVMGAPDYNQEVRVAADGSITLPFINRVQVGGLTTTQVAQMLQSRLALAGYFNNPQVSVFVKEYGTQGVSVLGEVQKPGVYPVFGERRLFDVLSAAQGTTAAAGDKVSITHRGQPQQPEIVKLTLSGKDSAQSNVRVFPGDTVVVQRAGTVYVLGDVQKPTGIVMADGNLTALQAIALAQGTNPSAALGKATLVRKTNDGQVEMPLHLNEMLSAKIPDMRLLPDDIIFVPNSKLRTGVKRGLEAALQTVTGVIIYRGP
jgi:polysaccharide export outer membrane protein